MHPQLRAAAERQGGVFTTAQACALGYSDDEIARLCRREWRRVRRGVYVEAERYAAADDLERHRLAIAAMRVTLRRPAVVTHSSAAVLHGLSLYEPDLALVSVTRPELKASRIEARVHHHAGSLPARHVTEVSGWPVSTLARTAIDIARSADFAHGVVAADAALRAGATSDELLDVMTLCGQWQGGRMAGRVAAFADGRAASAGESLTRVLFAQQGLPDPELQRPFSDAAGVIGVVDFLFEEQATIVEFDGKLKYRVLPGADPDAAGDTVFREKRREDRLRALGCEVVRLVWSDLFRPEATAARIRRAFALAAQRRIAR